MIKRNDSAVIKKYGARETAEKLVFPVELNAKAQERANIELRAALALRRAGMSAEEKLEAKILQLSFQIEDYVKDNQFDKRKTFGYFLKSYILKLNRKQSEFASDIHIKPAQLSQYINNHRTPTQDVIIRLELHCHNIISAVDWYKLLEKQKLHELKTDRSLRNAQRKYVKNAQLAEKQYSPRKNGLKAVT
jgi:plasmid maintenance system antidote protein VapI